MAPSIAVVVPTMGRPAVLGDCLRGLVEQTRQPDEVVVVTGDDHPDLAGVVQRFGTSLTLRVVRQRETGVVGARNDGWRAAGTDLVAFIDDDAVPESSWCAAVLEAFASDHDVIGVTGPTVVPASYRAARDVFRIVDGAGHGSLPHRLAGWYYATLVMGHLGAAVARMGPGGLQSLGSNFPTARLLPGMVDVDYLEACNMAFRRAELAPLDGFDPSYRGTGEWNEPDLAFRLRASGGRLVFHPGAAVEHRPSRSGVFTSRRAAAERMHNYLRFYFRWMWRPARLPAFLATTLMFNAYWVAKFVQSRDMAWLSGVAATGTGVVRYGLLARERLPAGSLPPDGAIPNGAPRR